MTLAEYLNKHGMTQVEFARRIEVPSATVSRWCAGIMVPRPRRIRQIAEVTDGQVQAGDWFSETNISDGAAA